MSAIEPIIHVVDDNASSLAATSRLLRASGFAVRTFVSATEFLARRDADALGSGEIATSPAQRIHRNSLVSKRLRLKLEKPASPPRWWRDARKN